MNENGDLKVEGGKQGAPIGTGDRRPTRVTVCACTYKRPDGLTALLAGLGEQVFSSVPAPRWDIVIADNEGSNEARAVCERFRETSDVPLTYVHEPKRGISHARNACLDRIPADSDFFAMIDDDEIPEPDWLDQLLRTQRDTGADVVLGRVLPRFDASAPQWVKDGGFFGSPSRRPGSVDDIYTDQEEIGGGATNNVLVRCSAYRRLNLRFDPERGLTGGSDSLFFRLLKLAGHPIIFAADAKVWETIPPGRTTLKYLLRSEYRGGNLKLLNKLQAKKAGAGRLETARMALKLGGRGLAEIALGAFDVLRASLKSEHRMANVAMGAMRIAGGCGTLTGLVGLKFEHYR
jgi:glycosyltransferase involved in cell wall biosynthesis